MSCHGYLQIEIIEFAIYVYLLTPRILTIPSLRIRHHTSAQVAMMSFCHLPGSHGQVRAEVKTTVDGVRLMGRLVPKKQKYLPPVEVILHS